MVIKRLTGRGYDNYESSSIVHFELGKTLDKKTKRIPYSMTIRLSRDTTYNCQMTIMGNTSALLSSYSTDEVVSVFKQLKSDDELHTRCVLVDIYAGGTKKLLEAVAKLGWNIVFNNPYTNTTGSSMAMIYIDAHPEWDEDDYDDDDDDDDDY